MRKGFIFTFDAALAAALAVVLFVVALTLPSINTGAYFGKLQLVSIGNDFLAVLEQNKTFDGYVDQSQAYVTGDIQNHLITLPPNYCANVTVSTYDYSVSSTTFVLDDQYNVTRTGCTVSTKDTVGVKRVFITFTPEKYGKA